MSFWKFLLATTTAAGSRGLETEKVDAAKQDAELDGLAALDYHERLTHFLRGSTRHAVGSDTTVLDFRRLFALAIYHHQRELAETVRGGPAGTLTDAQLERIQRLTERYANALRDFEFIHANRWRTSFVKDIAASRIDNGPGSKLHAALLSELSLCPPLPTPTSTSPAPPPTAVTATATSIVYTDADLLGRFDPNLLQHSSTLGIPPTRGTALQRRDAARAARLAWRRFAFASSGGVVIVAPMALLAAGSAPLRDLLVAAAFILAFAAGVAVFSAAQPESLLAATAAYAAVLVVFVGSGPGGRD